MIIRPKLRDLSRKFIVENKGIAAIEFALIAPIMIAFYFGVTEISMAISADREVAHTASVAGDLATQVSQLDGDGVEDIMTASLAILGISSSEIKDVTVELSSYIVDPNNNSINLIGYARMGDEISTGGPATFDPSVIKTDLLTASSGLVVARVNFKYSPLTFTFMDNTTLHETFYLKPRKSISVPFDENGKSNFSCKANANLKVNCS